MENFTFVEYEILSIEKDPTGQLISAVVKPHYAFIEAAHNYQFTREEVIARMKKHEKFYMMQAGVKTSVILVELGGTQSIRSDTEQVTNDWINT